MGLTIGVEPEPKCTDNTKFSLNFPHGLAVTAWDEPFSDRVWVDVGEEAGAHPLAETLRATAIERGRGRVVVLAPTRCAQELSAGGFVTEGVMPGYYRGSVDCAVMGWYRTPERGVLGRPGLVRQVRGILDAKAGTVSRHDDAPIAEMAGPEDAAEIAELIGETFAQYPSPTDDPAYVARSIAAGKPFAIVREGGEIVACAGADLMRAARTAELTDCATRPDHRGRGMMQAILRRLMRHLARAGYPTVFTLARATVPGVNLAFQRLGFVLRGTMPQSCRIGVSIEDMNIWSRPLAAEAVLAPTRPRIRRPAVAVSMAAG